MDPDLNSSPYPLNLSGSHHVAISPYQSDKAARITCQTSVMTSHCLVAVIPSLGTDTLFPTHISSIRDMGDQSGASQFRLLFEAALEDYRKQTGTKLVDHPLYARLIKCDSVESITAVLHEQAQAFLKFRGDDGKVIKSLNTTVHVLYSLSVNTLLGEAIGLVCPKALKNVPSS
jgi:hypothetical protein